MCQVLYFLSGLTCDDQTFIVKSNAQRKASEHGIALITCDTSPRGLNIDGEEEDWDFGTGAGFYLNATQPKWKQYRMYDYVVKELPEVLQSLAGLDVHKVGISGLQSVKKSHFTTIPLSMCPIKASFVFWHGMRLAI